MRLLSEAERRKARRKLFTYYPDEGPLARHLYPKHIEFLAAGKTYRERCAICANRVGKTESMGGYETTLHLTGRYPDWWAGKRFEHPISAWAAGKTRETTRDIVQTKLLGPVLQQGARRVFAGTGLIPGEDIGGFTWRHGTNNLADTIMVRHQAGGWSVLGLKAYEQGSGSFEGTEKHLIWLDEEPPQGVYGECLIRLATTGGLIMVTFTPLEGITEVVEGFLPGLGIGPVPENPSKYVVNAGWDDVPHLDEKTKTELLASTPLYLRDARSKGLPKLGEGVIFPIDDEKIICDPFAIPEHWPRIAGIDFGWTHPTAGAWLAWDREADIVYLYDDYGQSQQPTAVHASAFKARGEWIPVAWPHDGNNDTAQGPQLSEAYRKEGVKMLWERAQFEEIGMDGENRTSRSSVEAGLLDMYNRMLTGRWKVFEHLAGWLGEKAIYRRDKGKIVKTNDDRIDASRYAYMMLRYAAVNKPSRGLSADWDTQDWRLG